ncbi:MAG: aldo/keto reductase [Alphaproteobacteria bacterium]|nr:aldo/keto reductase [Alphaproteobacteria bacterium]
MDYVTLAPGLAPSSRLGFGCASVMGRVGRAASHRAIAAALDAGITHFDVAPLYGDGEAEGLLGEALAGVPRERLVIASKFGLEPPRSAGALRALKPLAQRLVAAVPGARGMVRALAGGSNALASCCSPEAAAASLDRSLAALRTDYLDILFLHDCAATDLSEPLIAFLDRQRDAGKIKAYGVATNIDAALALYEMHADRLVYQFANGLFARNAGRLAEAPVAIVGHSPFAGGERLRGLVPRNQVHRLMLSHALADRNVGVVLCSMLDPAHLAANLAVAEQPPAGDEELVAAMMAAAD